MRKLSAYTGQMTFTVYFGEELRRYRLAAGMSLEDLGRATNYSGSLIGHVENARRACPWTLAERSDDRLEARGALVSSWKKANEEPHPHWFQPYVAAEAEADAIFEFQPLVISGLLQTRPFAYHVIRAGRPEATEDEIAHEIDARMRRQEIFQRPVPPRHWLVLDEATLRRPIGGPEVMRDQLDVMLKAAESPRTTIQVLPFAAGAHVCLEGTLVLLGTDRRLAFCEGFNTARLIADPEEVAECAHTFEVLQATALGIPESLDLIREVMEGYAA